MDSLWIEHANRTPIIFSVQDIYINIYFFLSTYLVINFWYFLISISEKSYQPKLADESMKEKLKFSDIAGLDNAKNQLTEIIDYLKDPIK